MTYLPLHILEERRELWLSPKGGPLSRAEQKQLYDKDPYSMSVDERKVMLDRLLLAYWDHPLDLSIPAEICLYTGQNPEKVFPPGYHGAAEYLHDSILQQRGRTDGNEPRAVDKREYLKLHKMAERLDRLSPG